MIVCSLTLISRHEQAPSFPLRSVSRCPLRRRATPRPAGQHAHRQGANLPGTQMPVVSHNFGAHGNQNFCQMGVDSQRISQNPPRNESNIYDCQQR